MNKDLELLPQSNNSRVILGESIEDSIVEAIIVFRQSKAYRMAKFREAIAPLGKNPEFKMVFNKLESLWKALEGDPVKNENLDIIIKFFTCEIEFILTKTPRLKEDIESAYTCFQKDLYELRISEKILVAIAAVTLSVLGFCLGCMLGMGVGGIPGAVIGGSIGSIALPGFFWGMERSKRHIINSDQIPTASDRFDSVVNSITSCHATFYRPNQNKTNPNTINTPDQLKPTYKDWKMQS